jgi:hypothetical protein
MRKKTVKVMIELPLKVHNLYKLEKIKSDDVRSLNEIYLELIIKNTKK